MPARVLVLCYHAVADLSGDRVLAEYGTPPERFAAQLDLLAKRHTFVGLDDVLAAFDGGPPLPRRAVLVTFDDGYVDFAEAALPALAERGIPSVLFAVAGRLGGTNEWDRARGARSLDLLDANGLAAVRAERVEIGAHTVTHPALPELSDEELAEELRGAADRLEAAGLPRPRAFAFPYGNRDARVVRAVGEAGYSIAFTIDAGVADARADRLELPRVQVLASDRGPRFRLRVSAASWPAPARSAANRLLWP
jgi:peptidoglycan/xylan/chitin deacetylase (PgdA/CDA1 family)